MSLTTTAEGRRTSEARRTGWLTAAASITRALTEEDEDVRSLLDSAVESLRRLEGADVLALFVDDGGGLREICSVGGADLTPGMLLGTRAPAPRTFDGQTGPRDVTAGVLGWVADRVVLVPVCPGRGPLVVLALAWVREPGPAGDVDSRCARLFLDEVAAAVGLAGRIESRIRRAVARDRDRIARDLHDHVIQRLFAVGLSLQAASVTAAAAGAVDSAVDSLDETIRDVRRAIFALHERDPASDGRADLDALVGAGGTSLGFLPVLTVRGPLGSLPPALRRETLAVVREALSNVVRHARATHVDIDIDITVADRAWLTLTVTDDGAGIDAAVPGEGLGVANIVQRAREWGGHAAVGPTALGGTQLRWSVPLPAG